MLVKSASQALFLTCACQMVLSNSVFAFCFAILLLNSAFEFCFSILLCNSAFEFCFAILLFNSGNSAFEFWSLILLCNSAFEFLNLRIFKQICVSDMCIQSSNLCFCGIRVEGLFTGPYGMRLSLATLISSMFFPSVLSPLGGSFFARAKQTYWLEIPHFRCCVKQYGRRVAATGELGLREVGYVRGCERVGEN